MLKEVGVPFCPPSIFHLTAELSQTLPANKSRQSSPECCDDSNAHSHDKPLPLHKLLVYPVILSISNYVALAFLNISAGALLPLFLAMPLDIGGLNITPPVIGYIIGSLGMVDSIFQAFCFGPIVRRWGERNVFVAAMSTSIPIFLIFPVINFVARGWGQLSSGVWLLLGCLLVLLTLMDMAYGMVMCLTLIFTQRLLKHRTARSHFYLRYRVHS